MLNFSIRLGSRRKPGTPLLIISFIFENCASSSSIGQGKKKEDSFIRTPDAAESTGSAAMVPQTRYATMHHFLEWLCEMASVCWPQAAGGYSHSAPAIC